MSERCTRWGGPCIPDEQGRCTECGDLVAWALDTEQVPAADADSGTAYTRAQLAAAVDEAHAALHRWEQQAGPGHPLHEEVTRAHEALHRVGAGMPRSATAREASALVDIRLTSDELDAVIEYLEVLTGDEVHPDIGSALPKLRVARGPR